MKNIIKLIVFVVVISNILAANYGLVFAQSDAENIVSFSALGQKEIGLQGPVDIEAFSFRLPGDWDLVDGGYLHLDFSTFFNGGNESSSTGALPTAGYLQITINDVSIATLSLNKIGDNSIDIPLSAYVWDVVNSTDPSRLEFTVRTPGPCNTNFMASYGPSGGLNVIIHPSSYLYLPHKITPLVTDLRLLPYPIFQNSFLPDTAIVVMPENPTELELQAALITSAAFGRLSSGALILNPSTVETLTQSQMTDSHLIFVGKPSSFPLSSTAAWPVQVTAQGFSDPEIGANDGVVQMTMSPQTPSKVWLMVSGESDEAVVMAAQVLANEGNIRVGDDPSFSIVTDVQELPTGDIEAVDTTFSDLGYDNQDSWGPGIRYTEYTFSVPSGYEVTYDAYLDLVYAHSAMLDFDGAGISISLNGDYVGSLRFGQETTQVSTWHLNLPKSSFVQGENHLLISANLVPLSSCLSTNQLWFSSRSDSVLHLPLVIASESPQMLLRKYPEPFRPTLSNTAIVVSGSDSYSWLVASQLAFDLGWKTSGVVIDPVVAFADTLTNEVRTERNILLVGRPSMMPGVMDELAINMPAPFENGSDIATEPSANFSFNVPDNIAVGYLQIFPSPWNADKTVLTVTGNGNEGLKMAADALTIPEEFSQLRGNAAVIYNDQIISAEIGSDQVIVMGTPVAVATQTAQAEQVSDDESGLISNPMIFAVVIIVVLALAIIVYLVLRARQQRRENDK